MTPQIVRSFDPVATDTPTPAPASAYVNFLLDSFACSRSLASIPSMDVYKTPAEEVPSLYTPIEPRFPGSYLSRQMFKGKAGEEHIPLADWRHKDDTRYDADGYVDALIVLGVPVCFISILAWHFVVA